MKAKKIQGSKIALTAGLLVSLAASANAQLLHRYDFDSVNDTVGTANGTLVGTASLAGGALVTAGGKGTVNGTWSGTGPRMTVDGSAVAGITGAFTIETWFTCTTGWPKFDTVYAFSDSTAANYLLSAPVRGGAPWQSSVAMKGAGGTATGSWDYFANGIYLDTPGVHQQLATYDGTTLSYYVDGVLANFAGLPATVINSGFNLSTLTSIGINGGSPYGDPSLTGSTYDFRIYGQSLTADEVSSVYGLGSDASTASIISAITPVPEPSTLALAGLGLLTSLILRRKNKV
jgi:hypothetical protein